MVLALIAVLVGGAAGLAAGGRIRNLERVDLRWIALPAAWLALSVWARRGDGSLRFAALLASMACLFGFLVLNAVRLPGLWLVAVGVGLNLFMTANNHGIPYDPAALRSAGIVPDTFDAVPRATVAAHPKRSGDQLVALGQVIPIRPLRMVVSFGDLFTAFGLGAATMNALVLGGSGDTRARHRRRRRSGSGVAEGVGGDGGVGSETAFARNSTSPSASGPALALGQAPEVSTFATPLEDPEILRVVALLDDGRALLDLTSATHAATDVVELSARHAVRRALARHDVPDTYLRTEPDE